MSVFLPDMYIKRVTDVTVKMLKDHGVKGIILDVDNTLTHHGSQNVDDAVILWLKLMKENGFELIIVSNNTNARIKPFAARLGLEYVAMGCKPLPHGYNVAKKKFKLISNEIVIIGDQIYTDILGGNLAGMKTILVKPFKYEKETFMRLKRKLEKRHIKRFKKKVKAEK